MAAVTPWGKDVELPFALDPSVLVFSIRKASVSTDADVLSAVDVTHYPDGQAVSLEAIFGNSLKYDEATGRVVSASIFMQVSKV